jgi:hydroxymethylglutaryl-CoA lyase
MANSSNSVRIVEVGPRDGLQNVKAVVPTAVKTALIARLCDAGLQTIEITSTVSPKAIPQLADCRSVMADARVQSIIQNSKLRAPVLVPNLKGMRVAMSHGIREVAVFVSASEGFSKANIKCTVQDGLDRAREVAESSRKQGMSVRG